MDVYVWMCMYVCSYVGMYYLPDALHSSRPKHTYMHTYIHTCIWQSGMDVRLKTYHIGTGVGGRVYGSAWDDLLLFLNECLPSSGGYVNMYVCMYMCMYA
jgi:hypothetical protein